MVVALLWAQAAACASGGDGGGGGPGASGAGGMIDPSCRADCTGRECGPDGCGRSCGTCPAGEVCGLDAICQPSCPLNSAPVDGACACDFGTAVVPGCAGCLEDADRDGCPENSSPSSGQCRCAPGYTYDLNRCSCEQDPGPTLVDTIGRPCAGEADCADVLACHEGSCVCCNARQEADQWSCEPVSPDQAEMICNIERQISSIGMLRGPDALTNLGAGCFGLAPNNTYCAPQLQCAYQVEADVVRCSCCTDIAGVFQCSLEPAFALEHCLLR